MKGNYEQIKQELIDTLEKDFYHGDLADIGNLIGIVIGKHITQEMGFEKDSFLHGINHGISLTNGTHK